MTITIATLNIWNRMGDWDARSRVLKKQLKALSPDVIGLQEVLQLQYDGAAFDQAKELSEGLDYHVLYGRHPEAPHPMGNAILSRWPFRRTAVLPLPRVGTDEYRSVILAAIDSPKGEIAVACTHLNWRLDEGHVREEQIVFVAKELDRFASGTTLPAVLVGDLNAEPDSDEIRYLRGLTTLAGGRTYFSDAFLLAHEESAPWATYARSNPYAAPLREPDRRIDYVFSRGPDAEGRGEPLAARRVFDQGEAGVYPSDHFGVIAELHA